MVFSIVLAGITKGEITGKEKMWVIVGSPGVGKSVLTVLLCFHLAKEYKYPVFLGRQLKGDGVEMETPAGRRAGEVVICIDPGGKAVGYPGPATVRTDLIDVYDASHDPSGIQRLVVLDGWARDEIKEPLLAVFGGFDLLAASAQSLHLSKKSIDWLFYQHGRVVTSRGSGMRLNRGTIDWLDCSILRSSCTTLPAAHGCFLGRSLESNFGSMQLSLRLRNVLQWLYREWNSYPSPLLSQGQSNRVIRNCRAMELCSRFGVRSNATQ